MVGAKLDLVISYYQRAVAVVLQVARSAVSTSSMEGADQMCKKP